MVKLSRMPNDRDWKETPACLSVNNNQPAACGTMLVDTGITTMFLTVPEEQASGAILRGPGRSQTLAAGTTVSVAAGSAGAAQARYSFAVGDRRNPLAPDRLTFIPKDRAAFVNTGVHFLNGFDYLYDDGGGHVGFRWTGRAPDRFGTVVVGADPAGDDQTKGQR
jgi:hypothetical protein